MHMDRHLAEQFAAEDKLAWQANKSDAQTHVQVSDDDKVDNSKILHTIQRNNRQKMTRTACSNLLHLQQLAT